jgi:flagellar export protein FliJ
MKNFHFKLEALLKLRKVAEDKIKMRVGRLNIEKEKLKRDIEKQNKNIDTTYDAQQSQLDQQTKAQSLQYYPAYIEGKYQNIRVIKKKIEDLDEAINEQLKILAVEQAKVKVLDEMKDEKRSEFRKEKLKKIESTIEENNILWGALRGETK